MNSLRRVLLCLLRTKQFALFALLCMAPVRLVSAEDVTVQLKSGEELTGRLVDVAVDHVTVDFGRGQPTRFARASVANLKRDVVVAASDEHAGGGVDRDPARQPLTDTMRAATVSSLMVERANWAGRYTDTVGPVAATLLGVVGLAVGAGLMAKYADSAKERCTGFTYMGEHSYTNPGSYVCTGGYVVDKDEGLKVGAIASLAVGGLSLVTGIVLWSVRTPEGKRQENLNRIDDQLKLAGAGVTLRPWLDLRSGGAQLIGTF